MKSYEPSSIRNVAVIGHGNSGKTTLASALLFSAGAATRIGSIDEGTTVTDYDEDEIEKKISLQLALAHLEWKKNKVNLIDTPGYGNFIFEAKAGVSVADGAVVLIEAVAGVEVQTEKVWGFCEQYETPRLVMVSRMDRENASATRTLESLEKKFGRSCVPIQLPIGAEKDFCGVVDLVEMKAYTYEPDGSGKATTGEVPADLAEQADAARRSLMEMVAELDDDLMNKYLETETLEIDEFLAGLTKAVAERQIMPVLFSSGTLNIGSAQLLDAIAGLLPPPAAEAKGINPKDDSEAVRKAAEDEPLSAFVFKTMADPYAGRLSLIRVYSGKVEASDHVFNSSRGVMERTGALYTLQGKTQESVEVITAGDIGAIPKLKETTTNDSLSTKDQPITFPKIEFPEPAMSFAVEPKTRGDEDKLAGALARIQEEDPTVSFGRDPQTNELLVSGLGDTHVEVVVGKLKKKFGVDVLLKTPTVPYRETIKKKVEVQGRHKKQTGGRGQFADCSDQDGAPGRRRATSSSLDRDLRRLHSRRASGRRWRRASRRRAGSGVSGRLSGGRFQA